MPPISRTVASQLSCSVVALPPGRFTSGHEAAQSRGQALEANQIGGSRAEAISDQAAVFITQCADVVTPQPHRATAAGDADVLLDLLFGHAAGSRDRPN
jgi:hypothetical protein